MIAGSNHTLSIAAIGCEVEESVLLCRERILRLATLAQDDRVSLMTLGRAGAFYDLDSILQRIATPVCATLRNDNRGWILQHLFLAERHTGRSLRWICAGVLFLPYRRTSNARPYILFTEREDGGSN